jgi:hypothetical protein
MTRKPRPLGNLSKALLEMAGDMHNAGLMSDDTYRNINTRLFPFEGYSPLRRKVFSISQRWKM